MVENYTKTQEESKDRFFYSQTLKNCYGFHGLNSYMLHLSRDENYTNNPLFLLIENIFLKNEKTNLNQTTKESEEFVVNFHINKIVYDGYCFKTKINPKVPTDENEYKKYVYDMVENGYFDETINGLQFKLKYSNFKYDLIKTVINHLGLSKTTW